MTSKDTDLLNLGAAPSKVLRFVALWVIPAVWLLLSVALDPDNGLNIKLPFAQKEAIMVHMLMTLFMGGIMLHMLRKLFLNYVDFSKLMAQATKTSQGAGLFAIAVSLFLLAIAVMSLCVVFLLGRF